MLRSIVVTTILMPTVVALTCSQALAQEAFFNSAMP